MTFGFYLARTLTSPAAAPKMPLHVRPEGARSISVDATLHTTIPGTWGVWLSGGGHLQVSGQPAIRDGRAHWVIADGYVTPTRPHRGRWTGIAHRDPSSAGLTASDELVPTRAGIVPAWRIESSSRRSDVWAVHVHGAGSSRAGTLRGVLAAAETGVTSFVAAYRNTEEGPRAGGGRSHLGATESGDIADVLEHLARAGAERFVLFGWSMGAQIVLPLAASDAWRERVAGVVLDSPVLNWQHTLAHNLTAARLPAATAGLATAWLKSPRRSLLVGMDEPVDVAEMDWVRRSAEVTAPVLIHHGSTDKTTPVADSRAFVGGADGRELVESMADHTVSWNLDPEKWAGRTTAFVRGLRL
ncbi:MAG: alpha/beta fold hydrolase [Microbacterium sp.]|uniref:alpha/beta hydrolase family protein n=1 Tax=Microbacterium sp. TaxID=51671 RepID=UPI001AC45C3A|nr:alpha/beta fold hydrolase [Microbacterium sp.]MBN9214793.1 alpha/beta fold hydrolase [Microbacterium sp.]